MRVAAIDIGSNSLRLLIADMALRDGGPPSVRAVARAGESCRLARGLGESGLIDPEMAERAVHIAAEFAERARELGAQRIVIGATAALRGAGNGDEVARMIENETGIAVRILTGRTRRAWFIDRSWPAWGRGPKGAPASCSTLAGAVRKW